jgi:hypothetical protein
VPERDEDHRRVAVTVSPARARTLDELLHFLDGEILTWPALGIEKPPRGYCPENDVRHTPALPIFRG